MTPRRSEQLADSSGKTTVHNESIAKSVALHGVSPPVDAFLSKVIQAWPTLSSGACQSILAVVESEATGK